MPQSNDPSVIGWTGNPWQQQIEQWIKAIPELAPLARQLMAAIEGAAPRNTGGWADPMLQEAIPKLGAGMSPAEELVQKREIGDAYRSAVGAGGFAGGSGGSFSPQGVRRYATREAGQRLAPAMAELMAKKEGMQRQGQEAQVGALTSIYPTQARAGEQSREGFGQLLGQLLQGSGLNRKPVLWSNWTPAGRSW